MKNIRTRLAVAAVVAAVGVVGATAPVSAATDNETGAGVIATFEGKTIDLSKGWGDAGACFADANGTRCYRTETEMDHAEQVVVQPLSSCGSTLTLYSGSGFTGSTLGLSTRLTALNLASYGFDNTTSSYKIGSCSAKFYDVYPGTTLYPGSTSAGVTASTMSSGWDDRISSVYIN
ncbi:MAG: hypothetical protein QM733_04495 [Ilumatobacteraceae bacterium]